MTELTTNNVVLRRTLIVFAAAVVAVYILPLGLRPFIMPDEYRYAEIPREMISSGDWILPRIDGLHYFEKPPMHYWATGLSMLVFGENHFAVRLPSALASIATAAILGLFVWRRFGAKTGLIAAAVLLSSIMFFLVGTYAVTDPLLTLFITACLVSFYEAVESPPGRRRLALLAVAGACSGMAFLTKGFLAGVVPAITIVPFLLWQKRWKDIFRLPWLPLLAAVVIAIPWAIAIHLSDSDFWRYFFWEEHIRRFTSSKPQHPEAWWYFIPTLLGGALPWSFFMPAIAGRLRSYLSEPRLRYCICWLVFPFLFFSASHGKLGTYILPCFPPLAALMAVGLSTVLSEGRGRSLAIARWCSVALPLVLVTAIIIMQIMFPNDHHAYGADEIIKPVLLVIGLLAWAAIGVYSALRKPREVLLIALAPVLFFAFIHIGYPKRAEPDRAPGRIVRKLATRIDPNAIIISDSRLVHVVCWALKRSDVYMIYKGGEFRYGLSRPEAKDREMGPAQIARRVATFRPGESIVYFALKHYWKRVEKALPKPTAIHREGDLLAIEYRAPKRQKP